LTPPGPKAVHGAGAPSAAAPPGKLTIVAHRGACLVAVENTLDAFAKALAAGADVLETDVRATRDRELVLFHDPTLQSLAGRPERIDALPWDELRAIPIGPPAAPEPVCRLTDLLRFVGAGPARVLLDLKPPVDYGRELARAVAETGEGQTAIVAVRSVDELRRLRQWLPGIATLGFGNPLDGVWALADEGIDVIRLRSIWVDEPTVARAKAYGRPVWVIGGGPAGSEAGTATLESLRWYRQLGVDGVIVNDLALAVRANA
jgi:glycerophosphoryl diester phosphodiesterase